VNLGDIELRDPIHTIYPPKLAGLPTTCCVILGESVVIPLSHETSGSSAECMGRKCWGNLGEEGVKDSSDMTRFALPEPALRAFVHLSTAEG
jgi:hypothetical protein